jgi:hypothetical protein
VRQSAQIPPDYRAHAQALLTSLPMDRLLPYLYPNFYALHNMPPEVPSPLFVHGCTALTTSGRRARWAGTG